jgi:hypothetical protein
VELLVYVDYWIAGILLAASQLIRASAFRTLVANVQVFRLRDVVGVNSFAAILNILGPFRAGDIIKTIFFSRKGLGPRFSIFALIIERSFDLSITLILFLFIANDREVTSLLTIVLVLLQMIFLYVITKKGIRSSNKWGFLKLKYIGSLFRLHEFLNYLGKLTLAWIVAFLGVLTLENRHSGLLESWISWNSKFGEPFSLLVSRNQFLILVLILPIAGLLLSTVLFKDSARIASKYLQQEAIKNGNNLGPVHRESSNFSGSGCEIFSQNSYGASRSSVEESYLCKVEPKNRSGFLELQANFMQNNLETFNFPKVYNNGKSANFSFVVMENIINHSTKMQSENYARLISDCDPGTAAKLLSEVVEFLSSGKNSNLDIDSRPSKALLVERLDRVYAFITIQESLIRKANSQSRAFGLTLNEVIRLIEKRFLFDVNSPSHGDATLSNFLRQEVADGHAIRAIDPNPRVQIGRIEFDLGKIMQSTHSLYENTLINPSLIEIGLAGFIRESQLDAKAKLFEDSLRRCEIELDLELLRLFHLTHLIRILPYQYLRGKKHVDYWQAVINYQFEKDFK